MDCQSRCTVCPTILSVYGSDYIRWVFVRLFYSSIVRLPGKENYLWTVRVSVPSVRRFYRFMGLITSDGCPSDYSIYLSFDYRVGRIICGLSESVCRLSDYSIGLSV